MHTQHNECAPLYWCVCLGFQLDFQIHVIRSDVDYSRIEVDLLYKKKISMHGKQQ